MAAKKNNHLGINVKTDFLSPRVPNLKKVKTTAFGLGPVKKINFMPAKTKKGSVHKQISASLVLPTKKVKFVSPEQFLTPYPKKGGKKVNKKNMNWFQAKQKFPKLNPFGDADKDKVINMFDCKPFDPKHDGIISSAKAAASKVGSAVGSAAKSVSTAAKQAYTSVDKSLGGALPGGAKPTSSAAKAVEKVLTVAASPVSAVSSATKAATTAAKTTINKISSGGGGGGGRGTTTPKMSGITGGTITGGTTETITETTTTPSETPKITLFGGGTAGGKSERGMGGLTGATTTVETKGTFGKVAGKVGQVVYNAADIVTLGTLPGGVFKPAWDLGNIYSYADTKYAGGELPGGALSPQLTTSAINLQQEKKTPERHVDIFTTPEPETKELPPKPKERERERETISIPATINVKSFFQDTAGKYYSGGRWRPHNITAMADIQPVQLSLIGLDTLGNRDVPLILNINPLEGTKIPDYILALRPTIIYTTELPTRLAIMTPKVGGTGAKEYTQYNLRISDIPQ